MVLVVDDDPVQAFLLKAYLSEFVHVTLADDGEDGYNKILDMHKDGELNSIKFVITDLQMPKLDGFGFTRLMKSNVNTKHIPIFGYTSSNIEDVIDLAVSVGMNRVFNKMESPLICIEKLKSLSFL